MVVIPAIDLKDKKAVRLTKGLMDSAKVYSQNPWELAKEFEKMGAEWMHIVDLDGAFAGEPKNLEVIKKIRESVDIKIELGGGIRSEDTIKRYIDLGIDRVILGSVAVKDPDFVKKMAKKYPLAVGIDAIDGYVAVEGWASTTSIRAEELAKMFAMEGVEAIICTDVSKDGTLSGVNVDFTLKIAKSSKIPTIASGGVRNLDDIQKLKQTGEIFGVIVGKAFYEGTLDLKEAIKLAKN